MSIVNNHVQHILVLHANLHTHTHTFLTNPLISMHPAVPGVSAEEINRVIIRLIFLCLLYEVGGGKRILFIPTKLNVISDEC